MHAGHGFECDHLTWLVVLACTISVLGAYCALRLADQIPRATGWRRGGWVASASIAMGGCAIWSMHFISMIACRLPVPVSYDATMTIASLLIAIVVSGIGLYIVGGRATNVTRLVAGGTFMGLGVAAMHYTGMAAMRLPATTTYVPALVIASIVIAIVAATAALWISFNLPGGWQRAASSLVMGAAVCGMHYTAMAGASFTPTSAHAASSFASFGSNGLGVIVFIITVVVLGSLSMGSSLVEKAQTEEILIRAHADLERLVADRTAELAKTNVVLQAENVERRQIESRLEQQRAFLRQVIDTNPNFIFAKDRDGRFTLVNKAIADAYGTTVEQLIGKTDADFNPDATEVAFFLNADREVMDTLREKFIPEEKITDSTGKVRWLQTVKRPIIGDAGTAEQVLGVATDITERKTLELQFRQAQKMEAVGTLAGGVAHDFNNLLTVILSYSELLVEGIGADDPLRRNVDEIKKAGVRAATLTRQLLAFSRKQVVELKVLDLSAIVTDMKNMLGRLIGEAIVAVTVSDPALGHVRADRGQIEQVVMNLVVNAADAMPRGGKLTIECRNVELRSPVARDDFKIKAGRYVMLGVRDTGTGMDAETRARIFEPFFTTKETGKGTGLGLSTVYGIVKQNAGYVWVDSEPGHGTTFTIYLPQVDNPLDRTEAIDATRPVNGTETILLVEDEEAVRSLTAKTLGRTGYTVLVAGNGDEAIDVVAATDKPIDLVLTDCVMPGMSIGDLLGRLRSARPGVRLMLMSGYTNEEIISSGIVTSEIPFLEKPFTATVLLRKVRDVLDAK